jgi:hypothetical protein
VHQHWDWCYFDKFSDMDDALFGLVAHVFVADPK